MVTNRGVKGISRMIQANCGSFICSAGGFSVYHVCQCSVGVFSWRCIERETQRAAQPEVWQTCMLQLAAERKKERPFNRCVKETRIEFLLGMRGLCFLSVVSGRLLFLYLFALFLSLFLFSMLLLIFSFLIQSLLLINYIFVNFWNIHNPACWGSVSYISLLSSGAK